MMHGQTQIKITSVISLFCVYMFYLLYPSHVQILSYPLSFLKLVICVLFKKDIEFHGHML